MLILFYYNFIKKETPAQIEHLQWLRLIVLPQYGKVSWGVSSLNWLPSWSKTYTKRCTNDSLLSRDKTIFSLLELIDYVLSISEYVMEKPLVAFDFDGKLTFVAQISR